MLETVFNQLDDALKDLLYIAVIKTFVEQDVVLVCSLQAFHKVIFDVLFN